MDKIYLLKFLMVLKQYSFRDDELAYAKINLIKNSFSQTKILNCVKMATKFREIGKNIFDHWP